MGIGGRLGKLTTSPSVEFVGTLLRGVGQVMLQNNPLTGALFLLGIFVSSVVAGVYAVVGTLVATTTAMLVGIPRSSVRQGLYGFNGTLVAIDLSFYAERQWALLAYVVLACAAASVVTAAMQKFLDSQHVPSLTAAFVVTVWVFLAAMYQFGRLRGLSPPLPAPHLPAQSPAPMGTVAPVDWLTGVFRGFSQVFLQNSVWTGVVFFVAILVSSRISALAALAGSAIGLGTGFLLGLPAADLRGGLMGFNAVLSVIALGGIYYLLDRWSALLAALAGATSVVVYAALTTVLTPLGLPVVTAPFVVTTWVCLFASGSLGRLHPVDPGEASTPEANLRSSRGNRSSRALPEQPSDGI